MGRYGTLDREAMANSAHFGPVRWLRPGCPFGVKMRNTQNEQMFSGVALTTDITLAFDSSRTPLVTDNYFTRR